ncbi:MAG: PAS domain S-box protein [Myxococcales bacterium]
MARDESRPLEPLGDRPGPPAHPDVERALKEGEELGRLFELTPDLLCIADPEGRLVRTNAAWEATLGYSCEELRGRPLTDFLHPDDVAAARSAFAAQHRGLPVVGLVNRYRHKDGSYRWLEWRSQSAQGPFVYAAARDITLRRQAEQALRFTQFAIDRAEDQAYWMMPDGRFFYVNDAACRSLGYTREELLALSVSDIDPDFPPERVQEFWNRQRLKGVTTYTFETRHRAKDGRTHPVEIRGNRFEYEGREFHCAFATDITERKRAEHSLREASRRKDEFLAMLGHELRNPLGPIRSATAVLERTDSRDPRAQRARTILHRQTDHLTRIVNDLLDVSRIVRGKVTVQRQRLDLNALVRATADDFLEEVEAKGLRLSLSLPDAPQWVDGDATRLSQVLSNLLDNAAKFTDPPGAIQVELAPDPARRSVALTVSDTGLGMTREAMEHLFEPFEQAGGDIARSRGGVGLGLALAKGLVDLHGGTVRAQSAGPGQGSRFSVDLPLMEAPATHAPFPAAQPPAGHLRVLIVEDNDDAAACLQTLLELMGHVPLVASDGPSGLEAARKAHPDAVLCDIGLPGGMDGYDVAKTLRSEPDLRSALLVATTGYGQPEDKRRAAEAGFDVHLTKPVEPAQLEALLDDLAARRPSASAGGAVSP